MSDTDAMPRDRTKEARPERINIGVTEFVRNDIVAKQYALSVRTLDRGDALGAPFKYIGAVKYRPEPQYSEWVLSTVIRNNPAPPPRTTTRGPYRKRKAAVR